MMGSRLLLLFAVTLTVYLVFASATKIHTSKHKGSIPIPKSDKNHNLDADVAKVLNKAVLGNKLGDKVINHLSNKELREEVRHNLRRKAGVESRHHETHKKTNNNHNLRLPTPSPTGPVQAIPEIFASRLMSSDEEKVAKSLGESIGVFRSYGPREDGRFSLNGVFALRQIAMNLSLTYAHIQIIIPLPQTPLFQNFMVCRLDYRSPLLGEAFPESLDLRSIPATQTTYEAPYYCLNSYEIVSITGIDPHQIEEQLYADYQTILLDLNKHIITVQCARDTTTPPLTNYAGVQPQYYCTFIFVQLTALPSALSNCLCHSSTYDCCPTALIQSYRGYNPVTVGT